MATCPGVLGGRGVETCGPVPPLSHTPEFVLSVISSSPDAHSTRILVLWERENDGEGRQRNRQRKRETLQAFWLKMLSFVASSVAVAPCPCAMAHPALLCLRRYVQEEAVLKLVAQFMGGRGARCATRPLAWRCGMGPGNGSGGAWLAPLSSWTWKPTTMEAVLQSQWGARRWQAHCIWTAEPLEVVHSLYDHF